MTSSTTQRSSLASWWRPRNHIGGATGRAGLIVLAAALVVLFAVINPNFIGAGNLSTILVNVVLTQRGYGGLELPVVIEDSGRIIGSATVKMPRDCSSSNAASRQ